MAAYFGHLSIVHLLLRHGACVNAQSDSKATPIHKAVSTNQLRCVLALLSAGADTQLEDCEGNRPTELSRCDEITVALREAEKSNQRKKELQLMQAASEGNVALIQNLLASPHPPSLTCRDGLGNTPLHNAAYRGHPGVIDLLFQYTVDTTARNDEGKTPLDLSQSSKIRQLLDIEALNDGVHSKHFEGPLEMESRFFGRKLLWVVLDNGMLKWFKNSATAGHPSNELGSISLNRADIAVKEDGQSDGHMKIHFTNGQVQLWVVPIWQNQLQVRQIWVQKLAEHRRFGLENQPVQLALRDLAAQRQPRADLDCSWSSVEKHQADLEHQIQVLSSNLRQLKTSTSADGVKRLELQLSDILNTSRDMISTAAGAVAVARRREGLQRSQLNEIRERRRVLEDMNKVLDHKDDRGQSVPYYTKPRVGDGAEVIVAESLEFYDALSTPPLSSLPESFLGKGITALEELEFLADNQCYCMLDGCRQMLPQPAKPQTSLNLWDTVRQCVGEEMSQLNLPIFFCEPLSMAQRMTEAFQYATILDKAALLEDPILRMQYVATFIVASYSGDVDRVRKPFNGLLGETFEFTSQNGGFRSLVEQVSTQPAVTALHCEGKHFTVYSSIQSRVRLWGKNVEVHVPSVSTIVFPGRNEVYTFNHVNTRVHNLIIGKLWIEHCGEVEVHNHSNGLRAVLNFKPCGWFSRDLHMVQGTVLSPNLDALHYLCGKWPEELYSSVKALDHATVCAMSDEQKKEHGVQLLWRSVPRNPLAADYYDLPLFAITLNELRPEMKACLPPTDSRFRPDVRLMEEGDYKRAAVERNRIEAKHRRRLQAQDPKLCKPRWFRKTINPRTKHEEWVYAGNYWEQTHFDGCLDLY